MILDHDGAYSDGLDRTVALAIAYALVFQLDHVPLAKPILGRSIRLRCKRIGITTQALANSYSTIAAGGSLTVNGGDAASGETNGTVTNTSLTGRVIIDREGRYRSTKDGIFGNVHKSDPYSYHSMEDTFTVSSVITAGGTVTIDARTISNVVLSAQGGSAVDYAARAEGVTRGNITPAYGQDPVAGAAPIAGGTQVSGTAIAGVDIFAAMPVAAGVSGSLPAPSANLTLNLGGLFSYAGAGSNYLVETDPRFTNYGNFLSSDYFLGRLGYDPTRVQRRLGDALYEQQLITDQLVRQAGVGRLAGYGNNELQYRALMDAGVTAMQAFNLALGVGLSPEQMATLTSDIVLLVEVTVQTPDGPVKVLAPRVYLTQVSSRDMTSGGAIISGTNVNLRAADTLTNAGVIRASASSTILGNDILNSGRLDLGARGIVSAANDLTNRGGIITGGNITLAAGRDLTIESAVTTTRTATAWKVGGSRGTQTTETVTNQGSLIDASGNIDLFAGRNLTVKGSTVNAGGALTGQAETIAVVGAVDSNQLTVDSVKKSGGVLSSTKTTTHYEGTDQSVIGSTLSGDTVALRSTGNTSILGSNVVASNGVSIAAGGNIDVGTMVEQDSEEQSVKVKKSGISLSGSSLFVGVAKQKTDTSVASTTNIGSLIGSEKGDVTLDAGKALTITGSQVVGTGTTTLAGESVTIQNATDTVDSTSRSKSSSVGVSIAINNPVVNGAQTVARMGEIAGGDTANDRTKAVAGLAGGLAAINAGDAASSALGKAGGNPVDALKGMTSVDVTLGMSKSKSTTETHDETAVGSQVRGKDMVIVASGAGAASTITVQGSNIDATRDLTLAAEGAIDLRSAAETDTMSSSNKSSGFSAGVSIGLNGGITPTASANFGKGNASGTDVTHIESNLSAGGTARVTTPDALSLKGATLSGERVEVDVGSLAIESEQDTSTYQSKQTSVGVSVSVTDGANIAGNLSREKQSGDFASVNEQSGIFAGDAGFGIKVAGATDLKGAVIASTAVPERNSLTTGTLTASDIENHESYRASSMSIGGGVSGIGGGSGGTNAVGTDSDHKATTPGTPGTALPGIKVGGLGTISATPPVTMGASGSQEGTTYSAIAPGTITITSGDPASQTVAQTIRLRQEQQ